MVTSLLPEEEDLVRIKPRRLQAAPIVKRPRVAAALPPREIVVDDEGPTTISVPAKSARALPRRPKACTEMQTLKQGPRPLRPAAPLRTRTSRLVRNAAAVPLENCPQLKSGFQAAVPRVKAEANAEDAVELVTDRPVTVRVPVAGENDLTRPRKEEAIVPYMEAVKKSKQRMRPPKRFLEEPACLALDWKPAHGASGSSVHRQDARAAKRCNVGTARRKVQNWPVPEPRAPLEGSYGADLMQPCVPLRVQGIVLYVHKSMLRRIPYFDDIFNEKERRGLSGSPRREGLLDVELPCTAQEFGLILRKIYTHEPLDSSFVESFVTAVRLTRATCVLRIRDRFPELSSILRDTLRVDDIAEGRVTVDRDGDDFNLGAGVLPQDQLVGIAEAVQDRFLGNERTIRAASLFAMQVLDCATVTGMFERIAERPATPEFSPPTFMESLCDHMKRCAQAKVSLDSLVAMGRDDGDTKSSAVKARVIWDESFSETLVDVCQLAGPVTLARQLASFPVHQLFKLLSVPLLRALGPGTWQRLVSQRLLTQPRKFAKWLDRWRLIEMQKTLGGPCLQELRTALRPHMSLLQDGLAAMMAEKPKGGPIGVDLRVESVDLEE